MPSSATPADSTPQGRYHVARYGNSRNFALYEHGKLLAVTVYKKGASTVQGELEARDTVIAEQAARIEQLIAAATLPGPEQPAPAPTRFRDRRHDLPPEWGKVGKCALLALIHYHHECISAPDLDI
jgi:hypothetical protein